MEVGERDKKLATVASEAAGALALKLKKCTDGVIVCVIVKVLLHRKSLCDLACDKVSTVIIIPSAFSTVCKSLNPDYHYETLISE